MALGWVALLDLTGLRRPARSTLMAAPAVFLFAVAAAAPWLWIRPAYVPPAYPGPLATQVDIAFGDEMRLAGYEVESSTLRPGDRVRVRLEWQGRRPRGRARGGFLRLHEPGPGGALARLFYTSPSPPDRTRSLSSPFLLIKKTNI